MAASCAVVVMGRAAIMAVAMRRAFFSSPKRRDDRGQRAVIGGVDEISGAFARQAHAHVQRTIFAEAETARRLVELEGRYAQVQHHAIAGSRELVHAGEFALHQGQPAGEAFNQRLAARDGVGIAVDAQHAAVGGFQNGGGITTATKRAIDIRRAVAGRQHLDHFVQHHRDVAAHASPAGAFHARLHARQRFGFHRRIAFGIPDLEFLRLADENDLVLQPGMFDQRIGNADAAILVDRQRLGARDQRGGFVVEAGGEERILVRQPLVDAVQHCLAEGLQRGVDEAGADVDAGVFWAASRWR